MADCTFCGAGAGWFKEAHDDCLMKNQQGREQIANAAMLALAGGEPASFDRRVVAVTARESFIPEAQINELMKNGIERAVSQFLDDHLLSQEEENRFAEFLGAHGLNRQDMPEVFDRIVQCAALRDLTEGKVPQRMKVATTLPFNFGPDEQIVWVFNPARYAENRTRKSFVGGSTGVSMRIARGMYYRAGAFKGHPVETTELVEVGDGLMAVTTEHIFFQQFGGGKAVKLPLRKAIAFNPYDDGIGVSTGTARVQEHVFITGDGWFVFNLVKNLAALDDVAAEKGIGFGK